MTELVEGSVESVDEIGHDPKSVVRRWLLELKLASKEEKEWRDTASKLYKKYRAQECKKNSFNIFWANTEVMRQAVYSALPKPDVRRRFKDADPLGKAVSEVISRALTFCMGCYDFDQTIKMDVLDMLVSGRGLSRVRYIPSLTQTAEQDESETQEALESESTEELAWEQATIEHVQWDDFRRGPGKLWGDVGWVAFRHKLRRDELIKRFGKLGEKIPLTGTKDDDVQAVEQDDPRTAELFKTCEVWEIWDREEKTVLFLTEAYRDGPLQELEDPLGLEQFFPVPRPIASLEDSESLIPTPLYSLYQEQAEELERISTRINKIIDALKVRGIYDATLGELSELFKGADNELIPASNVTGLIERGGLDKFIWFAPIEQMAQVLKELYIQREQCKQAIYELTGISDVIRGSTDPNETATAQGLKSKWGSLRLQRLQADVQRYIRDLLCLMGELVAEKFQPETLMQMTMLPYLTQEQAQAQAMQYQMIARQAQQQGQQPPPPPEQPIIWEQVIQVLRSDAQRSYKIDIETDSTIAIELQQDMQGLQEVLGAIGQVLPTLEQVVQSGLMPFEAAKEILMTICRRAKFGNAVEDALDKMKPPPPPPDPEASKAQATMQIEQMKAQLQDQQHQRELAQEQQHQQLLAQIELQKEQQVQAFQNQQVEVQNQLEAQRMQLQQHNEAALEQMRIVAQAQESERENQFKLLIAKLSSATSIEVAEIGAQTTLQTAQISAANQAETAEE